MEGGAAPVVVTKAVQKPVPVEVAAVGNVEAYSTISVRGQVGGELTNVYFHEGDFVKKGDLLFAIDRRPLEAAVKQAEATLARDTAALSQYQANLARDMANERYSKAQAERYEKLFKEGVMSRDQMEQTTSAADAVSQAVAADRAAIDSAKADIAAAQASLENARVQLGYTEIRSPIDGRTGNLTVKQGNIITASSMELMTLNQVQPIYVTFSVPEMHLASIKRYMSEGKLLVTARAQDAEAQPETGVLTFVDNTVDPSTGTIKLKGSFANPDRKLWPGQFVRVTLRLTTQDNAIVIPNQAVQTGQDGTFVYVVKADHTVESRPVITGGRVDQDLVIEKGLHAGEVVVTEGQLRLAPGSRVQLRDDRPGAPGAPGGRRRGPRA
ncbi:MAG TPA: efflux RND transporter periplasmic adaptor subunit [Bryobacteraceae bacterium]|jgi:multidrug efflux system membrane fusion protein